MGAKQDVSDSKKEEILQFLLVNNINGKPGRGKVNEAAATFNVCRKTVSRIWETTKGQRERGEIMHVVGKRFMRIQQVKHQLNFDQIAQVHYQKRGTIRALADSLSVPKSEVGRWAKSHLIKAHTNAIKPAWTAPNKFSRLSFSLQAIEYDNVLNILRFKPMENACIFRGGSVVFDGKIGIWPFTEELMAKRNNKKMAAGTIQTKPINSITKQVIKNCLINQIVSEIKAKWSACLSKTIYIQQDNARPHINNSDLDFQAIAQSDGFNISLVQQPPNSPDCNVNDLGFFRAIQSLQQQQACRDAEELVNSVISSYNTLEAMTLNKVFLSLQCCLHEILKVKGCNSYKVPHMTKISLLLANELPTNLEILNELVQESIQLLIDAGHTDGLQRLISDLGMQGEDMYSQ